MVKGIFGGECVEHHQVYIMDRGGTQRVAQLLDLSSVQWSRVRDEVSEAQVILRGGSCSRQADVLAAIEPKRSELVIFRGDQRVWEGPVNRVGWHADWVEIAARDVMDYLYGRPLSRVWNNNYPATTTVTGRLKTIVEFELQNPYIYRDDQLRPVVIPAWEALDPPINVLPFFTIHPYPNEARTSARTTAFQMTVGEHLDNFARTGGVDYTVIGRAIHVWDVSRDLGLLRTMTEADFYGEIIVTAYGADHASVTFAVANDGRYGGAGGVATSWKFLQKTGPAGNQFKLPPKNATPMRPSIADSGTAAFAGYRYWMVYQPSGSSVMRAAGSKDTNTWKDLLGKDIDADPGTTGTPPNPIPYSTGSWPAAAFAYDQRLWLFFIGANGHLYRTRTEDGKDWTSQIDIYTPAAGVTLQSPSLIYEASVERWVLFGVDAAHGTLVYMTSNGNNLDGPGQWNTLNTAVVSGGGTPSAIEMRHIGARWVGLMTNTAGDTYVIESKTSNAAGGFNVGATVAFPKSAAGKHDTVQKATWLHRDDGLMAVWYGATLAGARKVFRTNLTGPLPDVGVGDKFMEYYGPWSKTFTVYDEEDTRPPTQADLNSQAKRNLSGRSPVPIEVRVPDNSGIRLSSGITLDTLVPGVHIPLLATLNSRQVSQMQKLHQITVSETSDGESIQVTLVPATKPDADVEEEDI